LSESKLLHIVRVFIEKTFAALSVQEYPQLLMEYCRWWCSLNGRLFCESLGRVQRPLDYSMPAIMRHKILKTLQCTSGLIDSSHCGFLLPS